jgi:hypothetical protein
MVLFPWFYRPQSEIGYKSGGASLIRTGDLRIMMPEQHFRRCLECTGLLWNLMDITVESLCGSMGA